MLMSSNNWSKIFFEHVTHMYVYIFTDIFQFYFFYDVNKTKAPFIGEQNILRKFSSHKIAEFVLGYDWTLSRRQ